MRPDFAAPGSSPGDGEAHPSGVAAEALAPKIPEAWVEGEPSHRILLASRVCAR